MMMVVDVGWAVDGVYVEARGREEGITSDGRHHNHTGRHMKLRILPQGGDFHPSKGELVQHPKRDGGVVHVRLLCLAKFPGLHVEKRWLLERTMLKLTLFSDTYTGYDCVFRSR